MHELQSGFLSVSQLHKIYFEIYGNKNGIPLLCFHGGPGGSFSTRYIDMIDPNKFYVIFFDQRGCGRSCPDAELRDNTCQDAINDAYMLLQHLNIDRCIVSGYSYGSTLALAFAEKYRDITISVYLSSVFIPTDFESIFFKQDHQLEAAYTKFIDTVKTNDAYILFKEYEKCAKSRKQEIVSAIVNWELELFQLQKTNFCSINDVDDRLISSKRIFLYYVTKCFFNIAPWVKENLYKLTDMPMAIVHGERDKITPISVAYELKQELPKLKIIAMPDTGHVGRIITKRYYDEINKYQL